MAPQVADYYNNQGLLLQEEGLVEQAMTSYRAAAARRRTADVLFNIGNLYLAQGLYNEAIGEYEEALELNADFADVYVNLASAQINVEDFAAAIIAYERFLELSTSGADEAMRQKIVIQLEALRQRQASRQSAP